MCQDVGWTDLALDIVQLRALVNMVINIFCPQKAWSMLTRWLTISFSRRNMLHIHAFMFKAIQALLYKIKSGR
jgi:hypothetical protein